VRRAAEIGRGERAMDLAGRRIRAPNFAEARVDRHIDATGRLGHGLDRLRLIARDQMGAGRHLAQLASRPSSIISKVPFACRNVGPHVRHRVTNKNKAHTGHAS
jgi:hypothetical protein